jgi:hypothetical protein
VYPNARLGLIGVRTQLDRSPVASIEGSIDCVLQGYLSNAAELRSMLGLAKEAPHSSIVLRGYEMYGESFFPQTDGSFNFLIHDHRSNTTFLVGDCYGHLPCFYYSDAQGRIVIAPELKAFKQCRWIDLQADRSAISDFLVFGQPWGGSTFFRHVYNLEAGVYLKWSDATRQVVKYWQIPYVRRNSSDNTIRTIAHELSSSLETSIRKLDSVPGTKALFISGGFDSRTIACYMQRVFGSTFDALGMQFNGLPATDSLVSTRIAKTLGLQWIPVDYVSNDAVRLLTEHLEIHDGTWPCSYFPHALPLEELSFKYQHIVNGNNGNHVFGDYATRYLLEQNSLTPDGVDIGLYQRLRGEGVQKLFLFGMMSGSKKLMLPMLDPACADLVCNNAFESFSRLFSSRPDLCGADMYEYLAITQTGRRYGLFNPPCQDYCEGLNPFYHDRQFLTLMSSIPREYKFCRFWNIEDLAINFPDVLAHPKISGYPSFLRYEEKVVNSDTRVDDYYDGASLFRHDLSEYIDDVLHGSTLVNRSWINVNYVHRIWEEHKQAQADHTAALSTIIALDYFLTTHNLDF